MNNYLFHRILRMPRTRGFGIQSPWTYTFVRTVVSPAPGVGESERSALPLEQFSVRRQRYCRFLCRLAKYLPAHSVWLVHDSVHPCAGQMVRAGSQTAEIQPFHGDLPSASGPTVLLLSLIDDNDPVLRSFLSAPHRNSVLILEQPYHNNITRARWNALRRYPSAGVVLDLYDCGVLFFDSTKVKGEYRVNLR